MLSGETIRVVVCGDEGVGKSSLITSLVKETFVSNIEHVIPPINIPVSTFELLTSTPAPSSILLIDTSVSDTAALQQELRNAHVIWLVYADHYTYERITLYWLLMFRDIGVNLPVVLCANKCDEDQDAPLPNVTSTDNSNSVENLGEAFIPILKKYKEIEACIRCSAKESYNVNEAFYLCQRAITHPILPLFDSKQGSLKPDVITALKRIFFLCDKDQDGFLNDAEFLELQLRCFGAELQPSDHQLLKATIAGLLPTYDEARGLSVDAFLLLNKIYSEKGRHETIWSILRSFQYTDSLSLDDKFLHPFLNVPASASVELSPQGYRFFVDLFLIFDKDNDGGLNEHELTELFSPTPGVPKLWQETNFPQTIVCNENGYVTLQGWLAQWLMTTFLDYHTTLAYLAYLGFESKFKTTKVSTVSALKVTKQRKRRQRKGRSFRAQITDRNVFSCFVVGESNSGKTSLLQSFLGRSYSNTYSPTIQPRTVVNNVELRGGKQCYLILEELGRLEPAILENQKRLNQCDVICYAYDSSDPESFQYIVDLREQYPGLDNIPCVYVALKADLDRQQQRCDVQPDNYTRDLYLPPPSHVSSSWPTSLNELFVRMVETAQVPSSATPGLEPEPEDVGMSPIVLAGGAVGVMACLSIWFWRRGIVEGVKAVTARKQ
ncbi:hypothetical protein BABINDRAFT_30522 [Babjeviella inositovora NRRL Y-12698]|uniref:Mitochondrial Rho GTPase n=1 Tax=Babjeviella inositovora NRRL Y-12698 TaxID=984486 RepID=A0A1E3QY03_9ASCO|nr:uncharacterized protein BABINDRAFT_30522 [Babjeviella inositovora NRRL Y-12698]ODQ82523.1 hypothetical protein BABINDRAFT_30522 [Babjeviella inositovora NRRL Y-12698]